MVESQSLVGRFDGFVASFDELINLFLSVTAGFGEQYFSTFDDRGFDFLVAMGFVCVADFGFKQVKVGLLAREKFLCARYFGSVELFHRIIIPYI